MTEDVELRGFADNPVWNIFKPDEGRLLGSDTRVVVVQSDDTRLAQLIQVHGEARAMGRRGTGLFASLTRRYEPTEWGSAELYQVSVTAIFEPAGEETGTHYDYSTACPVCGAGRTRIGPLRLKLGRIPKGAGIARTIAQDEVIVHERVRDGILGAGLTGVEFERVSVTDNPKDASTPWYVLRVVSAQLSYAPQARFGSSVLYPQNDFACPTGDTAGHALLSEALLVRRTGEIADFGQTRQYVGNRRGLLVPFRHLLVSPRVERALGLMLNGARLEIARFVQ